MRNTLVTSAAALALLAACGAFGSLAVADEEGSLISVKNYQGIAYVTGGVGAGERSALERMSKDFNLKLVFAAKGGPFLGDVAIEIRDAAGNEVLQGRSDGPWFFAKLPPGEYRVVATDQGRAQEQKVKVGETGLPELHFYWERAEHDRDAARPVGGSRAAAPKRAARG